MTEIEVRCNNHYWIERYGAGYAAWAKRDGEIGQIRITGEEPVARHEAADAIAAHQQAELCPPTPKRDTWYRPGGEWPPFFGSKRKQE